MAERLNLTVDDDIPELMADLAGSPRRRGRWLSELVRAMHETERQAHVSDVDQLKMAFAGLMGNIKIVEGRLMKVERQVDGLMSDSTNE